MLDKLHFSAELIFAGRGPVQFPSPTLHLLVGRGRLASSLAAVPLPPNVTLIVDDTVQIDVGPVGVGHYNGPIESAVVPMTVDALPAWALAMARARSAAVMIDSVKLAITRADLQDYQALYRVALCDTLPAR